LNEFFGISGNQITVKSIEIFNKILTHFWFWVIKINKNVDSLPIWLELS